MMTLIRRENENVYRLHVVDGIGSKSAFKRVLRWKVRDG